MNRFRRYAPFAAAVAFVLFAYLFFGSYGKFAFTRHWDGRPGDAMYAGLAEGFRLGELSMADKPDPRLMALPDPYDHAARHQEEIPYLWDASYYNGKYYLYFSPLPALLFYLPYRWIAGTYPLDQLAAVVFAMWAFVAGAFFVKRALAGMRLHVPLPLWIVMLGLGNVVPFIMVFSRTYEVAELCGAAMTATWALTLLLYLEAPRTSRLLWMTTFLGLSIAARPNLGVLLPIALIAVFLATPRARLLKTLAIAAVPLAIVAGAMLGYNYARFQDPLEFGVGYQLTYMHMADYDVCGCSNLPELLRLVNSSSIYLFAPPFFGGDFPFVLLPLQRLDPAVSFGGVSEEVGGLAPLVPLALIGSLAAAVLAIRRRTDGSGTRAALLVTAGGWLALAGLSSCWFVTARYAIDFMMLITAGALICFERGLTMLEEHGTRVRPLRAAAVALACYSVVVGVLLGFRGTGGQFFYGNPELFERLKNFF